MTHDDPVPTALELRPPQNARLVRRTFTAPDAALVAEVSAVPPVPTVPATPGDSVAVQAFVDLQHERARKGKGYSFAIADAATDAGLGQIDLLPGSHGRASVGDWVVLDLDAEGGAP